MMISRSAAGLAAAACLAMLAAGCGGSSSTAPGASGTRSPVAGTTAPVPASTLATPAPATKPPTPAPGTTTPAGQAAPRCHASELTVAYTGLNAAMGGVRGMILILTNHSGTTCHVYGYPGLAFFDDRGFTLATHLTWAKEPHATVVLRPGGSAQAMLTWRVNVEGTTPFSPDVAHVTPPDEYAYLYTNWPGGPVLGGDITAWPLRTAPAGPSPRAA